MGSAPGLPSVCFDHMVAAAQYYLRALGLPPDAPAQRPSPHTLYHLHMI